MKILVTAFEPFGGEQINPALEAVKLLPEQMQGIDLVKLVVPTVFNKSIQLVRQVVDKEKPDAVISVGQAGGRSGISVERVAINVDDARIPDNAGCQPVDKPVVKGGSAAYFSTLPVKAMVQQMRKAGIQAEVSNSAGTFVCNHLMYGVLHYIDTLKAPIRSGFVHVPFVQEQAVGGNKGKPSMPLEEIARGLQIGLQAVRDYSSDIHTPEGAEC